MFDNAPVLATETQACCGLVTLPIDQAQKPLKESLAALCNGLQLVHRTQIVTPNKERDINAYSSFRPFGADQHLI